MYENNMLQDELKKETERSRKSLYINLVILIILMIVFTLWRGRGGSTMKMEWSETALQITDPTGKLYAVQLADLEKVSLRENWDFGKQVEGGEDQSYRYGIWENEELGQYQLYAAAKGTCIILMESNTTPLAFSYESDTVTKDLYQSIIPMLEEFGYHPEFEPAAEEK